MEKHKTGAIFEFGNMQHAVIVKILDPAADRYYCVYYQNRLKWVVTEFLFTDGTWNMCNESGREVSESEWHYEVSKLKQHLGVK